METSLGITVSIALNDNKFLAKLASDLDKPRGFAVLSRSEAAAFLADKPVSLLWGVGAAMQRRLARGEDARTVVPHPPVRSISAETTLAREVLARTLWPLCEKVSDRLRQSAVAAGAITVKLQDR